MINELDNFNAAKVIGKLPVDMRDKTINSLNKERLKSRANSDPSSYAT